MTQPTDNQRKGKRHLQGTVSRRSGDKTVSVEVTRFAPHPVYSKNKQITKNYLVHDDDNSVEVGQEVTIVETRPFSRRKRYAVVAKKEETT